MKRFDAILKSATLTVSLLGLLTTTGFADTIQVSRCITVLSNWPVIMGWQNGTLQPKKIIIEISQENPESISGGKNFSGFDPRMHFALELNDPSDAGDYFPEDGLFNHNVEVIDSRTAPPKKYQTLLESKLFTKGNFIYSSKAKTKLRSPKSFQIQIQTQSLKDKSFYYSSTLSCENISKH